jgi:hypothetical protein
MSPMVPKGWVLHRVAEVLQRRGLGEGALRPEVADLQRLLQRQAGGHDLAEQPRHLLAVERPRVLALIRRRISASRSGR